MTDEQMQNLLTSIIEMKNNLERMAEKQEEMHNDVKKINERFKPFASKIYYVDQIFEDIVYEEDMFVGVSCSNDEVFRRMVVGNYHKKNDHLEVAHSYPWQTNEDHCPENKGGLDSFLAMYSRNRLNLKARVFPTNCVGEFQVTSSEQKCREIIDPKRFILKSNVVLPSTSYIPFSK